jgi:hypothetical protein
MSLREQLAADLKEAMKSRDETRKTVIRGMRAAITEAEQRKREDLVRQALKKRGIERPIGTGEADIAAYNIAVATTLAEDNIEAASQLDEAEILSVVQKLIKMRQDSIADAEKAGRADLAAAEQQELDILRGYLPQQLSREEIEAEARAVIAEVGAASARDMGRVMGPLMQRLQGRADGKAISDVVRSLLS